MVEYDNRGWLRVIFKGHGSVLRALLPRILVCGALGGLASYLFETAGFKIPSLIHTMLGVVLGLLLVFRTNASYDRYWEGRKLFGLFVNRSRDVVRQAASYLGGDEEELREVRRLVLLFYALLRQYLRAERDLAELGVPITDLEREALGPIAVRPNLSALWLSERLAAAAASGRLTEERLRMIDQNVTTLVDVWGGAERIMRTPIPFAYAQHIKTFLTLFCFTAPFAMVETMRAYTPLAAAILGFGMFGIDEIGVEIEDPFGRDPNDLPLDAIGKRIEEDTAAILSCRATKPNAAKRASISGRPAKLAVEPEA